MDSYAQPAPFNPLYDPRDAGWLRQAADSMDADGFYASHTRIDCAVEIRTRYNTIKEAAQ